MKFRSESIRSAVLMAVAVWFACPLGAWAAEEKGSSETILNIGKTINLLIVVGVLVWIGRKPLANFFASRSKAIQEQLAEAQHARREAEARLAEIEKSMSSLDDELKQIREAAESEARDEYARLVAAAEKDAARIVEQARQEIDGMTRAAQLELKRHVADLSVELAKNRIQAEMTDEDRERLFSRFVGKVGGSQ
jgi:F-type H+-transporting ATPase subunit b